jgi:tetratricopeptide (TPR) repeat protein
MNRDIWIGIVIGLLGGFIIGYFLGTARTPEAAPPILAAAPSAPAPVVVPPGFGMNPGAMPNTMALQARVLSNQQIVAREPKNLDAWKQLGNDYFDTHQSQQAVDAYAKALELEPGNPDILTDQGIMYRELKAYDKAIANFEKSFKLDPKHVQSLFNLGVVYSQDLKQNEKAIKVWKRVIEVAPTSSQATQARVAIAELGAH